MSFHPEKHTCPRRGNPTAASAALSRRQAERGGKAECPAEQSDRHLTCCGDSRIAGEPLWKVEPIMCALCPGERRRRESWAGRETLLHLHFHTLLPKERHTCASMKSPTPITPEERSRTDDEGMQEHTHLARLCCGAALPLTLFPQRAGATTADAGRIDDAQAPVGFPAPLMRNQRLASRLQGKVSPREAALFPGQGHRWRPIPLGGRSRGGRLFLCRGERRSKLGGAHRIRSKLMS
jgi:hypothetical protein